MKITSFEEYSKRAAETQLESCKNEDYLRLGLISEVGELAAIFKRAIRGDFKLDDKRQDILLELGDICWYLDRRANHGGFNYACEIDPTRIYILRLSDIVVELADLASKNYFCGERMLVCIMILANHFGFTIWDVLTANVEKLAKRKEMGLIIGSGDHRDEKSEGGAE